MQSIEETQNIGCFDDVIVDMLSNKKLNPRILNYLSEEIK